MRRLHVISHPEHEMGGEIYYRESDFMHSPELHHAYKCGVKQGWREAMAEVDRGEYAERHHYGRVGLPPMYRHEDFREPYPDEVEYRRHRDSMGRYTSR